MEKQNRGVRILLIVVVVIFVGIIVLFIYNAKQQKKPTIPNGVEVIDLTTMSSTMVYSYVYDMLYTAPDDYVGKAFKVKGQYYKTYYAFIEDYRHFVIISDAEACCAEGIEFKYDEDYPKDNSKVEIVGIFKKHEQAGSVTYLLDVWDLSVL